MNLFFSTLLSVQTITCVRILGIFPTPFYSHQSVYQPIWRELSTRGHQVTVITTDPIKNSSLTNLKEIDLSFSYKLVFEDHQMQSVVNTENRGFMLLKHAFFAMTNMTVEQLQHPDVLELLREDNEFDLMIVEAHVPAWFGLAKKYKCPVIAILSLVAPNHFKRLIGNPNNHPVYSHSVQLPFGEKLNFFQKVICVLFDILNEFALNYVLYPLHQKIIRQTLEDPEVDLFEIVANVSLLFTYEIPGLDKMETSMSSIIPLNGLQIKPPKKLPKELEDFLDEATEGAIYFSLGSVIKSCLISQEKQEIFLEVFNELPFKIVWKFERHIDNLPDNVKVIPWAPQQDILRHRNIKLFVTHGGTQSIEEAIRFKVPILGIPFVGDQFYYVTRVKELQIGTWIDFDSLSKEELKQVILQTINSTTISQNLEKISDLFTFSSNSLEKAVWWIEYVIRHKGAHHLKSPLGSASFHQYYLLDIIIFFVVCFVATTLASLRLLKILQKLWYELNSNKLKRQ